MEIVITVVADILAGLFILGLFVLPGTKNAGKRITKGMAIGMLICITAVSGGCLSQQDSIQKEDRNEFEKNDDTSDSAKADKSDTSGVKLKIGETQKKELWTQTYVYPDNIDDTFVIDVCLPDDYDKSKTYPVVYLTDCYWRRKDYGAIKDLYQSGKTKEFILIGIGYPDDYNFDLIRQRDLLREPDKFLDMIVYGVIPYVESTYPIDAKDRTFCGASYGGFFMIYSLFQNNGPTKDIFKNYVLASPTFWEYTDGHSLNDYEDLYYEKTDVLNENVYLTVGGEESKDEYLSPIDDFVKKVEKRGYNGLKLTYKVYEGKNHYTVWVPALLDGLTMYLAD